MRERVIGEEIEWAGGCLRESENAWVNIGAVFDKIIAAMNFEPEYKYNFGNSTGGFLANGTRVYCESTGQHFETALPECSSALEMLKFDKWSERFVSKITEKLKIKVGKFAFYKKSADSDLESTRGCHENYFSEGIFKKLLNESEKRLKNIDNFVHPEINYFILFLITRQIFTGSGGVMLYSRNKIQDDIYEISPRTYFIDAAISTSTTMSTSSGRAIINIRDEAWAQSDKYWRNHLILGDANMADLAIFLKFGATGAVIEMIEEGFWDENLRLANPAEAPAILKSVSKDLTLKQALICLENGENFTALQIQKRFCENWQAYLKYTNQGGEKAETAERWQEVLNRLETDDEKLYSQLDWKIKMRLIKDFASKKGFPLKHPSVIAIDNAYHSPDRERSFYYLLKNRPGSKFESLVSDSEISEADTTPPETRAKLRAHLGKIFSENNILHTLYWDNVVFHSNTIEGREYKIHMPDPRLSSLKSLDSPANYEAIRYLNALKPGAIII